MVARITSPSSISRALNYNEQKVRHGVAETLYAGNFLKQVEELSFQDKIGRFLLQNSLNEKVHKNTLHISLNFAAEDKLSKEKLITIAAEYMDKIGFGAQPYLLYQHHDSGHTHLHIVTTTIKPDGRQIRTFNIGKITSEKARKEIELRYGLTRAEGRKKELKKQEKESAQIACYGKNETKTAIQKILLEVINNYKYTSLGELNAVLGIYNVMADPGKENSRTFKYGGLYYRTLDDQGRKIGTPIKASAFYFKPTLPVLEEKFRQNEIARMEFARGIKTAIELEVRLRTHTLESLKQALRKELITLVIRRNPEGRLYGLTYVDLKNQVVFNGSDLGKEYAATGLSNRLAQKIVEQDKKAQLSKTISFHPSKANSEGISSNLTTKEEALQRALEIVLNPSLLNEELDPHLKPKKKRTI